MCNFDGHNFTSHCRHQWHSQTNAVLRSTLKPMQYKHQDTHSVLVFVLQYKHQDTHSVLQLASMCSVAPHQFGCVIDAGSDL